MRTQAICLALLLLCPAAPAQWVQLNGPDDDSSSGDIACLVVSGMNLPAPVFQTESLGPEDRTGKAGLFAGTGSSGVFRSTDNGISWREVNTGLMWHSFGGYYGAVICFAASGTNLLAGGHDGVYLSTDDGTSWTAVCAGLPWYKEGEYYRFYPVSCLAASGLSLFAGTDGYGVFLSTNNGTSWTAVNEGLQSFSSDDTAHYPGIAGLAVSGTHLFATAEYGRGIFGRPLSEMTSTAQSPSTQLPVTFRLHQNYPNPFNPTTRIRYTVGRVVVPSGALLSGVEPFESPQGSTLSPPEGRVEWVEGPASSRVSLVVYDVLGREVALLVNEKKSPGNYEVQFDGSGLASGVYIYRLTAGSFVQSRTMLLLK
jgi:hypothetical protein